MIQKKVKQAPRLAFFDGFRGLLILTILYYYFFQHILPGGFLSVNAFLFIAGFFAFRHFYVANAQGKGVNLPQYWIKRLQRIFFPTLFVVMCSTTFIVLFSPSFYYNLRNMGLSSLVFMNNYYQIFSQQSYFVQAANPSAFTHLWYIALYAQLIFLTPLLVKLIYSWNRNPVIAMNLLLVISLISAVLLGYWYQDGMDPSRIYYDLVTRAFAFTLGGAFGFLLPVKLKPKPLAAKQLMIFNIIGLSSFALLLVMLFFVYGTQSFAYRFGMTLFTILTAVFVSVSIHPATISHRVLSFPLFTFFGKRSLSYYLWFYPIHLVMPEKLTNISQPWLNALIQFVIIMVFAEVTYRLFEQRELILPFGQDFNWREIKRRVRFLIRHKRSLLGIKAISILYVLITSIGLVALILTPENKATTAEVLQNVITENQKLVEESSESVEETKVINNIEGLNRQALLQANALEVTFIGDSILLAATQPIKDVFPKAIIRGDIGRQLYQSVSYVNQLKEKGELKNTVVTILGTNGTFTEGQLNDYIEAMGSERELFFVTPSANRVWIQDANDKLFDAAKRYANVKLIDWRTFSSGHSDWLYEDEVHPNEVGALEFAKYIATEISTQR